LGRRESGKTDFSFFICEILFSLNVIRHFATNTKVYESSFPIERITNLPDLEHWAITLPGKKLFILDEAGKSFRRRTPMSKLNIELLDKVQILRKYKLSIIMIAPHEKYLDSATLGSDVLDGVFIKPYFKNPKVGIYEDILEPFKITINNIPRTSVKFDTWDVAPFNATKPPEKPKFQEKSLNILWEWSHGKTYKELGLHRMQINRLVRKFIKEVLENPQHKSLLLNISGKRNHSVTKESRIHG